MGQHQTPTAYEKQIVALGRVLQTLREEENADVLIETTLNYLQAEFNYRLIWIGLYDRLDHRIFGKGGFTPNGDMALLKQRFYLNPGDLLEQVVIQQRPVGVPDLREEVRAGEWRRAAQQFGIQGTLLFPLRCKDRCFGVALLGSHLWGVSPRVTEKAQMSLLFGGLASALYQIEVDWQRSSTKRPDQPLFQVLEQMVQLPNLQQRLEVVVNMTQQFVAPTRTSIYWFESARRYFWHRVGNRQSVRRLGDSQSSAAGITVTEVSEFYQALVEGQLVAIGAGRSPMKAEVTGRLLSRLRSRSVLAAPIKVREDLVGFLAAEGSEPRIWEDAEKNYVRAAAQLIALASGNEDMEEALRQSQQNTQIVQAVANILTSNTEPQVAFKQCTDLILELFKVERLLLLQPESDQRSSQSPIPNPQSPIPYKVAYQYHPSNRRPVTGPLSQLSANDRAMLEQTPKVLAIEDWEEDKRLAEWRNSLMPLGVRSLLICHIEEVGIGQEAIHRQDASATANTQLPTPPSSYLILGHGTTRTWNHSERHLLSAISQQFGMRLASWKFSSIAELASLGQQTLQAGLNVLLSAPIDPALLERAWMEYLSSLLGCPAFLLSWTTNQLQAQVTAAVLTEPRFSLPGDLSIPVATDGLIQEAIATDGLLCRRVADLPVGTRKWLSNSGMGQILALNLSVEGTKQPITEGGKLDFANYGIILIGDHEERQWPSHLFPVLEILEVTEAGIKKIKVGEEK